MTAADHREDGPVTTSVPDDVVALALGEGERRRRRFRLSMVGLVLLLGISVTVAVTWGSVPVPLGRVWTTIWSHVVHGTGTGGGIDAIVWEIRVPRVLLALVIGAGLALVGVAVQAMVRNPLADPYVLGVESGAAAAAVAVIYLGRVVAVQTVLSPTIAAFLGAMATLALVFALARRNGRVSSTRMLLVGVALSYALSGLTSFFLYASPDPAAQQQLLFWILGSLGAASWSMLPYAVAVVAAGAAIVLVHARQLNALSIGDTSAAAMGINPDRVRVRLLVVSSLIVAVIVALAGPIGFVGLVVPHVGRLMFGADHRRLIPSSLLLGGIYLVLVDLVCRTLFAPSEIPIGVMTAMLGTPFFLWLVRRNTSVGGDS